MPMASTLPVPYFRLTLEDREIAGMFRECSGLDSETEVTEQRSVDESGQPVTRKIAGATKWSDITLRRGADQSSDLWEWREVVHKHGQKAVRTDGTIELLDDEGSPIATYRFRQGWPVRYGLSASSEAAMEEVVIAHEGFERA